MLESSRQRSILGGCLKRNYDGWELFLDDYLPSLFHVICDVESRNGFHLNQVELNKEELLAGVITRFIENDFAILRNFRGESSLDTFLVVTARRIAIELCQSITSRKMFDRDQDNPVEPVSGAGNCSVDEVETMLENLKPIEREAVRLHYLEGCSLSEVAKQLKISESRLISLISRARKKIQRTR